jgi:hypothetical protein
MATSTPALIVTAGAGPDNSLPGIGSGGGNIDNSLPPPPGIWPPPVGIWPPVELPPGYPMPPGSIWPPVLDNALPGYGRPDQGLPGHPDQGLPGQPAHPIAPGGGAPDQGLPSKKFLVAIVAASAAGGLKVIGYTVVDPSLHVGGGPMPGNPPHVGGGPMPGGRPDQGLPPETVNPQTKR